MNDCITKTVYVGIDAHKKTHTLSCFSLGMEKPKYSMKIDADIDHILIYLETMRGEFFGDETDFICGYEAGCLGYTLYKELKEKNIKCKIIAPTTLKHETGSSKRKNDKRDSLDISKALAIGDYSEVHVPTEEDEAIKEYIRMRDDHKAQLKAIKQQISAFCLRHGFKYGKKTLWTSEHIKWLESLGIEGVLKETLDEYLITFRYHTNKVEKFDNRIQEFADSDNYKEKAGKLGCFLGIKTHTAMSLLTEVSDFNRFEKAGQFASFLGLTPGEHSSSDSINRLGITKAGNSHLRRLLIEAAQSIGRGKVGYKSKALKQRQEGNTSQVIAYADKANERLRRRYYKMIQSGKSSNTAKTAVARELACFIWGMMNDKVL